jgi:hypothetical protein
LEVWVNYTTTTLIRMEALKEGKMSGTMNTWTNNTITIIKPRTANHPVPQMMSDKPMLSLVTLAVTPRTLL